MFTTSFAAPDRFLSTLPARGATAVHRQLQGAGGISIHAPREGSDLVDVPAILAIDISIHAPREGSDRPPPPRSIPSAISIHAPREGSDMELQMGMKADTLFLSTLPARGATTTVAKLATTI